MNVPRAAAVLLLFLGLAGPPWSRGNLFAQVKCGNCSLPSPTLSRDADQSDVIVFGHFKNPRALGGDKAVTDLVVGQSLKGQRVLQGKTVLEVPRLIPVPDPKNLPQMLVFAVVTKGQLEFTRGVAATPATVQYFKGLLEVGGQDRRGRLRHCFDYLEHPDPTAAADSFLEYQQATEGELRRVAAHLPAERLRSWLRNDQTPPIRRGLYATLLGHCGTAADADLLAGLLPTPAARETPQDFEGVLRGYLLLRPAEGWRQVRGLLKDQSRDFTARFAALRTVRYLHEHRPDVIAAAERLAAVRLMLDDPDMADLAVNDLRSWKSWELTDHVLGLAARKSHESPIIRRAVLRYALRCPRPQAAQLVNDWRQRNRELVEELEEALKLEEGNAP